jgi:thiol-disulfide isomerase/thioredoxin
MKQTQGFGNVAIVGLVAAVLIIGAVGFVVSKNDTASEQQVMAEKMEMEKKEMVENNGTAVSDGEMLDKGTEMEMKNNEGTMIDEGPVNEGDMMKKEESAMMKKEESAMMEKSGSYTTYSGTSLAIAQKGRTVLFFHAGWCPTCRSADADIVKNQATIPAGVTILKTDYDTEVALKQKYGVTTQHTFVEVDSSGTMIQKWSGGNFAGIVAKL